MVPAGFKQENTVFMPPNGMTADECEPVNAFIGPDESGNTVVVTCWKLTKDEISELIETGRLWITICGGGMPPMVPSIKSPFSV